MKKNTILQLIVIYVGLNAVYYGVSNIVQNAAYYFSMRSSDTIFVLKLMAGYGLICLLGVLIMAKSGGMSNYIAERSGLDDSLTVYSKPQQLLSILIVVVALSQIITRLPYITDSAIEFFNDRSDLDATATRKPSFAFNFISILIPCLTIIFCRQLTAYFSKNILLDEEDMIAHQDTVEIETNDEDRDKNS